MKKSIIAALVAATAMLSGCTLFQSAMSNPDKCVKYATVAGKALGYVVANSQKYDVESKTKLADVLNETLNKLPGELTATNLMSEVTKATKAAVDTKVTDAATKSKIMKTVEEVTAMATASLKLIQNKYATQLADGEVCYKTVYSFIDSFSQTLDVIVKSAPDEDEAEFARVYAEVSEATK